MMMKAAIPVHSKPQPIFTKKSPTILTQPPLTPFSSSHDDDEDEIDDD